MNLKGLLNRYTVDQLKEAIRLRAHLGRTKALEAKRAALLRQVSKIDKKLSKLSGNGSASTPGPKPGRKRRSWKLSAETRRKMSEAAKRRYAGKGRSDTAIPRKKSRTISAAGRAAISAAQKARWARAKGSSASVEKTAQAP